MDASTSQASGTRPALRIERHFEGVAPEQVWRAWTEPQALSVWFGPGADNSVLHAEADVRVGGRFRVAFQMVDGQVHDVSGVYREVQQPAKLVFTWAWRSTPERESLVTVKLAATGSGTRMDFVHEQFFDEPARDDHEDGWTRTFDKLVRQLQSTSAHG